MKIYRISSIKPNSYISVITIAFLTLFANVSHACDLQFYGGNIARLSSGAHDQFWTAREIAWSAGKLSRSDTSRINLEAAPRAMRNVRNIWIRSDTVYFTDYFLKALVHNAIMTAFQRHQPNRFGQVEDVMRFKQAIYENGGSGISTEYYPLFLGLSYNQCLEVYRQARPNSILKTHAQTYLLNSMHFWFLHEIAHWKLGHSATNSVSDSWEQEYAADLWAFETLLKFQSPENFIALSSSVFESFSLFSDTSPTQEFAASQSHPSIACRKLKLINFAEQVLADNSNIDANSWARFEIGLMRIHRDYLRDAQGVSFSCASR